MTEVKPPRLYAPASLPDIVARLRHTIEALESARIVLCQDGAAAVEPLKLHLSQIDEELQHLIADIEGRA